MASSKTEALRTCSVRLSSDDMARVKTLALGDETFGQTLRRVIREAAQSAPKAKAKRRAAP